MLPKWHALLGFLFAYIAYWLTSMTIWQALLIFLAAVFIDVDHYLYYVAVKKRISLKSSYNWFKIRAGKLRKLSRKEKKKHRMTILIFHGIEPIVILFCLAKFFPVLAYIAIGFIFHLALDLIAEHKQGINYHKLSIFYSIYDHILKRKLKLLN